MARGKLDASGNYDTIEGTTHEPKQIEVRSPYEAYNVGKLDFNAAITSGLPLKCTLSPQEQLDSTLISHWVKGAKHAELNIVANSAVTKVQLNEIRRRWKARA